MEIYLFMVFKNHINRYISSRIKNYVQVYFCTFWILQCSGSKKELIALELKTAKHSQAHVWWQVGQISLKFYWILQVLLDIASRSNITKVLLDIASRSNITKVLLDIAPRVNVIIWSHLSIVLIIVEPNLPQQTSLSISFLVCNHFFNWFFFVHDGIVINKILSNNQV